MGSKGTVFCVSVAHQLCQQ